MLIMIFPNLALDVVEGNEFRGGKFIYFGSVLHNWHSIIIGASALHLAIAYNNLDLIKMLVEAGAGIEQRAVGTLLIDGFVFIFMDSFLNRIIS